MDRRNRNEPKPRVSPWAALLVALLLLSPLGFYLAYVRGGEDDPGGGFPDPSDAPANLLGCPPIRDLGPVKADTLEDQIDGVERAVERLRKLRSKRRVPITLLSPEDVAAGLEGDQLKGLSKREIERDTRTLEILGVMPKGTDLEELAKQLTGQIIGYYDTDERELFVNAASEEEVLPPLGELTLAHELEHAIADQTFGLPLGLKAPPSKADATLAKRSLVEGDATLLMRHYATSVLTPRQLGEIQSDPTAETALEGLEDIPPAIELLFGFPYTHGLAFACELFAEGGWRAVDNAYERPPSTTAQVMFPLRYREREGAVHVRAFGDLDEPWRRLGGSAIGAADLFALFSAPGGETRRALDDPTAAASGWAGGSVEVWARGEVSALGLALAERDPEDHLCDSVHGWYRASFPETTPAPEQPGDAMVVKGRGRVAVLRCPGSEVRLGIGPTRPTARALIE